MQLVVYHISIQYYFLFFVAAMSTQGKSWQMTQVWSADRGTRNSFIHTDFEDLKEKGRYMVF